MTIKKIKSGEATLSSEQNFLTAEDAYNDKDPTSEEKSRILKLIRPGLEGGKRRCR